MRGTLLRPGRLLLAIGATGVVAWIAYVTLMPVAPYQPICGLGRHSAYLKGPLRPEFVDQLIIALAEDGFRFRRVGERVLVPHLDVWPNCSPDPRPRRRSFRDLLNFQINTEWRLATNIARGRLWLGHDPLRSGRTITVPAPLQAHLHRLQEQYGPLPSHRSDPDWPWFDLFTTDCDLLRAALIRVEDLPDAPAGR